MPPEKPNNVESDEKKEFITIDHITRLAEELVDGLRQLSEYKYPLDVRSGREEVINLVSQSEKTKTIKAGSKTYFFDIKNTNTGKPFLVITESRFKGEGDERERNAIIVFPENAQEFLTVVNEMIDQLS